jgi:hypothetical protein
MINVPDTTTVNTSEFKPDDHSIAFAPELIEFIKDNQKLTTYRFGKKYDHFQVGDLVNYQNSETGEIIGKLSIINKREVTFATLPLENPTHEVYRSKEHQRQVLSGYYAYIGREIVDDDPFLIFDFILAAN